MKNHGRAHSKMTKKITIPLKCSVKSCLCVMLETDIENGLCMGAEVECEDGAVFAYDMGDAMRVMRGQMAVKDYLHVHKMSPLSFDEWATRYLCHRFDKYMVRAEAMEDYNQCTGEHITSYGFVKALRKWAEGHGAEYNPRNLCTPGTNGRILRRLGGDKGPVVDWIYVSEESKKKGGAL